jgi:hypothetical protein
MSTKREKLWELVPILVLGASVFVFFGRVIYLGKPLLGSDFALYFRPVKEFIRDYVLTHGTVPLWNPYILSGTPIVSNIQASMFYPLGVLFYVMPSEYAYGYTVILHCFLGAIFMYAFARSISLHKAGAFFAAVVFTYNGFFMGHLYAGHLTFVQTYIWIPLIFLYSYRFLHSSDFKHAMQAGMFFGIQAMERPALVCLAAWPLL